MTQPAPINLHPNEHSQEFHYYPFAVKVCVPDKTEDLNLSVFNMITRINELKTLTKHISCECKCKFDGRNCNPDQWWNNENVDVSVKNVMYVKKILFGILLHVIVKIPYLPSIMDDSAIMCDQIIESYQEETNFNEKKQPVKCKLAFLLVTTALLIAVSIYCYLIKYGGKQNHLLPFHFTNNKSKVIIY